MRCAVFWGSVTVVGDRDKVSGTYGARQITLTKRWKTRTGIVEGDGVRV